MEKEVIVCTRCVMDSKVPDIVFNENGICNYCEQFDAITADCPNNEDGEKYLNNLFSEIKEKGKGKKFDVLIGVSGGVDSTYLVQYAVNKGLKVLAVNFDNGWHSEIAVANIKNSLQKLGVDLITYVVDYDEMKDILLSYMKAGLPWIDAPTDGAINATLYKIARKNNIKYIFNGSSIRTEGKQPTAWTYSDSKQIKYILNKFGKEKIKTYPVLSPFKLIFFGAVKGIKVIRPFNFMQYDKAKTKEMLIREFGWKDYGGHHHESAFTKFAIAFWLPKKFDIDKRKVTYAAQVRSGLMNREKALELIALPPYDTNLMEDDKNYVIKKLGITRDDFDKIWSAPNKSIYDYPSYLPLFNKYLKYALHIFRYILPFKPMMGYKLKNKV